MSEAEPRDATTPLTQSVEAVTDGITEGMFLARLISDEVAKRTNRGAPWLAENALDPLTGETVFTRQSAYTLMNKPKVGALDPAQKRAIAALFGWSVAYVHDADGINQGLDISRSSSTFATMIPAAVDRLPTRRQVLIRDVIIALVEDNNLTER